MAFDAFHKHCKRCKKGNPCSRRHVYVMELNLDVLNQTKFKDANPNYKDGMDCVYVGKTSHHPRCRQSMHNNCKVGDWDGKSWTCYCKKKSGLNACSLATRTSGRVGKFMTGYLKPSLYKKFNPQRGSSNNSEAEEKLATNLRELGYGVWAGHLDLSSRE